MSLLILAVAADWLASLDGFLRTATPWLQSALWFFLGLALIWWAAERTGPARTKDAGAALVALPGGQFQAGAREELHGREVAIGTGKEGSIRVPYRRASLTAALISRVTSGYQLLALGGPGSVSLNGRPIHQPALLRDGDVLEIAGNPFRFELARIAWDRIGARHWLLIAGSVFFLLIQRAAWVTAGPARPPEWMLLGTAGAVILGMWAAHLLLLNRKGTLDPVLMPTTLVLLGLGLTVLLRTQPGFYARQAVAAILGVGVLLAVALTPLKGLVRFRYLSLGGAVVLLLMTVILGQRAGDQRLAISIMGFQFQPAEPAKVLLAIFLAGLLCERQELVARAGRSWALTRSDLRYLGPAALAWVLSLSLLIVQRDLGTTLLFFGLFAAFLTLASGRGVFLTLSLTALVFGIGFSIAVFDRVRERIDLWLNPWADPQGLGYQLCQGLFALGGGGIEGVGLGRGFPRLVPAAHTDLPLAVIGEELGLLGTLALLGLYLIMALRGYRVAAKSSDEFLGLLAAGLTTAMILQAVVIVGGVVRALPLTGVTLPFISFGGSSLVVNMAVIGALVGISTSAGEIVREEASPSASPFSWRRNLRWAGAAATVALAVLAGFLIYWQVEERQNLVWHANNPRILLLQTRVPRGKILDRQGQPLAWSERKEGRIVRHYKEGPLVGSILGYSSMRHGRTGVEGEANDALLGMTEGGDFRQAMDRAEKGLPGHNVRLTLKLPLQKVAAAALGNRRGSVVAIDPRTGAIRAMVSQPRASFEDVDKRWEELTKDRKRPFLFRATQGVYPPGSTFKAVTAAIALDAGIVKPETRFYCPGAASVGNYTWRCFGGKAHGHLNFSDALRVSCNVTFGLVGRKLGRDRLVQGAKKLGIGLPPPMELEAAAGLIDPHSEPWASIPPQLGFGQGPLAVTPLQMALVASAIANDGKLMRPHLIHDTEDESKRILWKHKPEVWQQAMKPGTARILRRMMGNVVEGGTGVRARLQGVRVGGKTGTAENPHGEDHAWFISLAPVEKPSLAVAVLVEGGGQGGRVSAPIARKIFAAHFGIKEKSP